MGVPRDFQLYTRWLAGPGAAGRMDRHEYRLAVQGNMLCCTLQARKMGRKELIKAGTCIPVNAYTELKKSIWMGGWKNAP